MQSYSYYHGDFHDFTQHMNAIATKYNKPIVITETNYPWTNNYYDEYHNILDTKKNGPAPGMPAYDPAGQAEFMRRFLTALKAVPNGRGAGFFYWEPAWLTSKSFGSPVDNTTLFGPKGAALPALEVIQKEAR